VAAAAEAARARTSPQASSIPGRRPSGESGPAGSRRVAVPLGRRPSGEACRLAHPARVLRRPAVVPVRRRPCPSRPRASPRAQPPRPGGTGLWVPPGCLAAFPAALRLLRLLRSGCAPAAVPRPLPCLAPVGSCQPSLLTPQPAPDTPPLPPHTVPCAPRAHTRPRLWRSSPARWLPAARALPAPAQAGAQRPGRVPPARPRGTPCGSPGGAPARPARHEAHRVAGRSRLHRLRRGRPALGTCRSGRRWRRRRDGRRRRAAR
jgi:hypothetical protein